MLDEFESLELAEEYPGWFLNRTKALRIYRTSHKDKEGLTRYRYHFGYPEELVKPVHQLLETTPFWGEQHWKEIDGYWLWWTMIVKSNKDYPTEEELNRENNFRRRAFGKVIDFYRK